MSNDQVIQFRGTIYENGYGMLARKVMRDKDLSPTAKSIYAYICSFAGVGKDGKVSAFPGVNIMMVELGIKTDKTYYRHRKQLIEKGYITIEKNRNKGKFENNIYFIEAVPVEKEENARDSNEVEPHSKKDSKVKPHGGNSPYGKNSSLTKSSLKKEGTIITRSINTRFNHEEEDIYTGENIFFLKLQKFLQEKNIKPKTTKSIIEKMIHHHVNEFNLGHVMQQYEHMMQMSKHSRIYDFSTYFVNGLIKIIEQSDASNQYQYEENLLNEMRESDTSVYYDWTQSEVVEEY